MEKMVKTRWNPVEFEWYDTRYDPNQVIKYDYLWDRFTHLAHTTPSLRSTLLSHLCNVASASANQKRPSGSPLWGWRSTLILQLLRGLEYGETSFQRICPSREGTARSHKGRGRDCRAGEAKLEFCSLLKIWVTALALWGLALSWRRRMFWVPLIADLLCNFW